MAMSHFASPPPQKKGLKNQNTALKIFSVQTTTTVRVNSLNSGKVATTPILTSVLTSVRLLFSKLQSRCTLTGQFSPNIAQKVYTQRKLQQFIVSGWLIMNGGESEDEKKENFKVEITFNMKRQYNC